MKDAVLLLKVLKINMKLGQTVCVMTPLKYIYIFF